MQKTGDSFSVSLTRRLTAFRRNYSHQVTSDAQLRLSHSCRFAAAHLVDSILPVVEVRDVRDARETRSYV